MVPLKPFRLKFDGTAKEKRGQKPVTCLYTSAVKGGDFYGGKHTDTAQSWFDVSNYLTQLHVFCCLKVIFVFIFQLHKISKLGMFPVPCRVTKYEK